MVVLRRSAGSRRRSLAAMDSSSEFLSLQPGGRRTSRQRAAPAYKQQEEVRTKKMTVKMFQGVTTFDGGNLLTATKLLWKAVRQRDRERTNSGQPCSVRQKESLENAGSQKCRRRARQRHADDISDSTPSCSSPLLSTCDTEESGESSEDSESTSPRRLDLRTWVVFPNTSQL
ncbi:uncharacterized protein [Anas platyrhynchos]|uniref:uncharacterized protein isoform X3 n=1 Tax=Anas platyrhynchos TaxID=8839 RepID=UPI003AF20D0A